MANGNTCIVHPLEIKGFLDLFRPMAETDPEFAVYLQGNNNELYMSVRLTKTNGDRIYFPVHCFKQILTVKVDGSFCVAVPLMRFCLMLDSYMQANNSDVTFKINLLQGNKFSMDIGFSAEDGTYAAHDQLEVFGDKPINISPMKFRGKVDNLDLQHNHDEWIQIKAPKCNIRFALQTPGDIKEFGEALSVISPGKNIDNLTKGNFFASIIDINPEFKTEVKETPMTQVAEAVVQTPPPVVTEEPAKKRRGRPPAVKPVVDVPTEAPKAPTEAVKPVPEVSKVVSQTTPAPATEETKVETEDANQKRGRRSAAQKLADDLKDAQTLLESNGYTVSLNEAVELNSVQALNEDIRNKLAVINRQIFGIADNLNASNQMAVALVVPQNVDISDVLAKATKDVLLAELQKRLTA